jgi:hypothetical protein
MRMFALVLVASSALLSGCIGATSDTDENIAGEATPSQSKALGSPEDSAVTGVDRQ